MIRKKKTQKPAVFRGFYNYIFKNTDVGTYKSLVIDKEYVENKPINRVFTD